MGTSERLLIRRFTADEAMRMADAGILGAGERVELLGGALVEMSPQGPRHAASTARLANRLRGVYTDAHVREEKPLSASEHDLPEPDVAVVRGREEDYLERHPTGADALLVVELALSSQAIDRQKAAVYAAAGVEVYWLVDLAARRLELRSTPEGGGYLVTRTLAEDDVIELPGADARWLVRDLLP